MSTPVRIVFVDGGSGPAEELAAYFSGLGYESASLADGWALEAHLRQRGGDLVVLDLDLPGRGGLDLLRDSPALAEVAVILLTPRDDPVERVIGLELGADDIMTRPVEPRELAARVAAVLGRRQGRRRSLVLFETVSVDLAAQRLLRAGGTSERLTPGEIALIRAFAACPGRVLGREDLIALAPADSEDAFDRSIDSRVARLRRKLGTASIHTVRGHGYRFDPPFSDPAREA